MRRSEKKKSGPRRTIQVWGVELYDGTKVNAGDELSDGRHIVSVYNLGGKDGEGYKMVFADNSEEFVYTDQVAVGNPRFN
ncbi:MAG: hypothetical protein H8D24_00220 [Gammaproteobacteria bacterium]|uniref:Uncharacterized protein n=1 Tax=Candidatus Thiopontia autotrophica TaxID=2841688 RepID=A0A8J6P6I9_9GAMM|nr:hypothetical protein [Candidatus Thiopontia autotrophica]